MPLVQTRGAASAQGFGEFAQASVPNYIEEVFSCFLYTGTGATNNIVNGIDLAGKGGLVWTKARTTTSAFTFAHALVDTLRGVGIQLSSDRTDANTTQATSLTAFNSNGYTLGADTGQGRVNNSSYGTQTYVGWTFRKQPKFFDVVTYTGNGTLQNIAHNLGSTPGCILVKSTSAVHDWAVYHRSLGSTQFLKLNKTASAATASSLWNDTNPSSTTFTVGSDGDTNDSGTTYVAYLFAHDAGGFGLSGTDNVISCGSYSGTGSVPNDITLGFEPQWLLVKNTTSSGQEWGMFDNMRGLVTGTDGDAQLFANASSAENISAYFRATATGFACEDASTRYNASGNTYIYIAIRRGPMKVPTSGTSVFNIVSRTGTGATATVTGVGFPVDLVFAKNQSNATFYWDWIDRLRGPDRNLFSNATDAEYSNATVAYQSLTSFANMDGVVLGADGWNAYINGASNPYTNYFWRRAPSFFDEVCYTGTNSGGLSQTISHNLGVAPELIIFKKRAAVSNWTVVMPPISSNSISLNLNAVSGTSYIQFVDTYGTSSITTASGYDTISENTTTYVAYLFATCAGVSKVGSYTGTGTTLQVNCGFTAGARFVLIKRTDSTGAWYVWDSARGIVSGNDPYLLLNSDAAEVTNTDYIDTYSAGFEISSTAPSAINASAGTFIFLAIA